MLSTVQTDIIFYFSFDNTLSMKENERRTRSRMKQMNQKTLEKQFLTASYTHYKFCVRKDFEFRAILGTLGTDAENYIFAFTFFS